MNRRFIITILLFVVCFSTDAHALDRRLKLMFKTAGYGAAAGGLIGGAVAALGVGDARNIFMGASSGMYAGILLAAYIVATPPDTDARRHQNPYAPRRKAGPRDWKDEGWEDEDFERPVDPLPPGASGAPSSESRVQKLAFQSARENAVRASRREWLIWTPVLRVIF